MNAMRKASQSEQLLYYGYCYVLEHETDNARHLEPTKTPRADPDEKEQTAPYEPASFLSFPTSLTHLPITQSATTYSWLIMRLKPDNLTT